ncbi:transposase [Xenorhabdus sp. TS4]|nr:transposase [Xenorhabdus sp. TS4]
MATIEVKCRFCQQTEFVKKHCKGDASHQRYRCLSCKRTFQLEYAYKACQIGIKEQLVDLAMNNAGIRDTARVLHISINTVVHALKNSTHGVSLQYSSGGKNRLAGITKRGDGHIRKLLVQGARAVIYHINRRHDNYGEWIKN